jgi:hypothetical protein
MALRVRREAAEELARSGGEGPHAIRLRMAFESLEAAAAVSCRLQGAALCVLRLMIMALEPRSLQFFVNSQSKDERWVCWMHRGAAVGSGRPERLR